MRVPTYDSPQVGQNLLPSVQAAAPVVQDTAGMQTQQLGRAMQGVGSEMGRIAADMANEANQLRVDDAMNQAKEAALRLTYDKDIGYSNVRGFDALQRQSGKPLADEYADSLKEHLDSIHAKLGNEQQRQLFQLRSNDLLTQFHGQAIAHESQQFRDYALSVREGTISNSMQEIGLNYNNPEAIDQSILSIKAATADQGRLLGKSAEWVEAQTRKMTSNAHKVALAAALEKNDIVYAEGYLKKYASQMDADDLLKAQGLITKEMDSRIALGTATGVIQALAPRILTSDNDRAFNIAVGTESNGRQFDRNGAPLTSPKGAIGAAQVMPATGPEAAKLAGLPWDENRYRNDRDYNLALGKAYFNKQVQDFGGDLSLAYAAYNAGPGATREAIKKAERSVQLNKTDPTVQVRQWIDFMPKETRDYVAKNVAAYGAGEGQYQKPTLMDVHAAIRQQLGTSSPSRLKLALDEATRQYDEIGKAVKQREDEVVSNAYRALYENGGRFSALPASIRGAIPAKEIPAVMNAAERIAKGNDVTNMALYQRLATDQNFLKGLSDNEFFRLRPELSESDFKHFANERAGLISGKATNGAEDLNTAAINTVLNDRLRTLGIDPTPKDDGGADAMRVGAIRKFVRESVANAQSVTGKKLTDAEVEKHVDGLFAKSDEFRRSFLGIPLGSSSGRLLGMTASNIPSDIRDRLKADFKAAGIANPTDADLLGAFWKLKYSQR